MRFAVDIRTGRAFSMDAEGRVGVGRVLADGAHDSRANFNFLAGEGMEPIIGVRSGSAPRSGRSQAREQAVVEQRKYGPGA